MTPASVPLVTKLSSGDDGDPDARGNVPPSRASRSPAAVDEIDLLDVVLTGVAGPAFPIAGSNDIR